ncbi:hypothetical protein KWI07_17820 [Enterobacter bugandensis]|uniref:hypothetical protein n=1 Tax=Enterobacter bugandensis TaxID=881260 RepID=UPI0021D2A4FD|nr:hypothetical protein [Enterobacter bugandensis]MCU6162286.1 hypothetical protein [Enterobacter bugandensis]
MELAQHYFIATDKILCIVDGNTFGSKMHLVSYLEFLRDIKPDLSIMVADDNPPDNSHVWFLKTNAPVLSWKDAIDAMNFIAPNIDSVIGFYRNETVCKTWGN